jgi:hypothetical protein
MYHYFIYVFYHFVRNHLTDLGHLHARVHVPKFANAINDLFNRVEVMNKSDVMIWGVDGLVVNLNALINSLELSLIILVFVLFALLFALSNFHI